MTDQAEQAPKVDQLDLGELVDLLKAIYTEHPGRIAPFGFRNPHSYRGDYSQLAFEPACNVPVADMLTYARFALGATYQGWKGGDFTMTKSTACWLAREGESAAETIGWLSLHLMLGLPPKIEGEPS
jgi:hypothetical protein